MPKRSSRALAEPASVYQRCYRAVAAALGLWVTLTFAACSNAPIDYSGPTADWPEYGGNKGGTSYSALNQITTDNVDQLQVAWVYNHGDFSDGTTGDTKRTSFQARPLVADDTLFFCTPFNRIVALDPATGTERWTFDPKLRNRGGQGPYPLTCRGVAYWADPRTGTNGAADATADCATRIFSGTRDSELIAVDARSGRPCADFGTDGRVDLREGMGEAPDWEYYPTSPPLPIGDVVVTGALVADSLRTDPPSGVIRAFDARTGQLRWAWDPVPPRWKYEPQPGGPTWQPGTPNAWSILSGDEEAGLVFIPTGNAAPDSFGGQRENLDYYASSTVALDADDGHLVWRFQTVHHDVWDYDVASQPAVFQIPGVGGGVPALAQATKMGHVFLLNRSNGRPLYPIQERPVPTDGVPGEQLSPTQPFPTHPAPLHPTDLTAEDAWGFTFIDRGNCREQLSKLRSDGLFTPPTLEGSIQYPGSAGGANWGGVSIDPARGLLFVNQIRSAAVVQLIPRADFDKLDLAKAGYPNELYPMNGTPYGVLRRPLLSNFGAPCNPPPWGTLTAVDLLTGEKRWEVRLGTTRDQAPWPLWLSLGAPNLGGSVATAGGLVFIAATTDKFVRAFASQSGEEVWRYRLPYTGNASPITYRLQDNAKQYVVLAAGGHGWSEPGDALMAFALPD